MQKILIIAGPTAVGKSKMAAAAAKERVGEVISADSMQIYRGMDIGTAKLTCAEMQGVPHHLIDELDPDEPYSAAIFQKMADERIAGIVAQGKLPIICGGTGFYINALLFGADFNAGDEDTGYRKQLALISAEKGNTIIHDMLKAVDPEAAAAIPCANEKRVIRALEFFKQTGKKISEHNQQMKARPPVYDAEIIILNADRGRLYERINERVDEMIKLGLEDEVRNLIAKGYGRDLVSMQGLGYKEMAMHIEGQCSLDDAVNAIKQGSRRFAKRQITWFRHQLPKANWRNITL